MVFKVRNVVGDLLIDDDGYMGESGRGHGRSVEQMMTILLAFVLLSFSGHL